MRVWPALIPLVFALLFFAATAAGAATIVSTITVGGDDHELQIDVDGSGPLDYLLSEKGQKIIHEQGEFPCTARVP